MLSDEEKKAIVELNHFSNMTAYWKQEEYTNSEIDNYIKIVLNLIEKQSKEIEELKKYKEGYKLLSYSLDNYTSKDKIKAKIEEVEQWELYNMKIPRLSTLDERLGAKIGIKYVLQSLLEKE